MNNPQEKIIILENNSQDNQDSDNVSELSAYIDSNASDEEEKFVKEDSNEMDSCSFSILTDNEDEVNEQD